MFWFPRQSSEIIFSGDRLHSAPMQPVERTAGHFMTQNIKSNEITSGLLSKIKLTRNKKHLR